MLIKRLYFKLNLKRLNLPCQYATLFGKTNTIKIYG